MCACRDLGVHLQYDAHFVTFIQYTVVIASAQLSNHCYKVSPEELAQHWNIGLALAKRTLHVTTQRGVKNLVNCALVQRVKQLTLQLQSCHLQTNLYTDTMFSKLKSLQGNMCAQVFVNDTDWTCAYPMKSKAKAHEVLDLLLHCKGVPAAVILDGAKELMNSIGSALCWHPCIRDRALLSLVEPCQNSNQSAKTYDKYSND